MDQIGSHDKHCPASEDEKNAVGSGFSVSRVGKGFSL